MGAKTSKRSPSTSSAPPPPEYADGPPTVLSTWCSLAQRARTTPAPLGGDRRKWCAKELLFVAKLVRFLSLKPDIGPDLVHHDDVLYMWNWLIQADLGTLARDLLKALNLQDDDSFTLKLAYSRE